MKYLIYEGRSFYDGAVHDYLQIDCMPIGKICDGAIVRMDRTGKAKFSDSNVTLDDWVLLNLLIVPGVIHLSLDAYSVEIEYDSAKFDRQAFLQIAEHTIRQHLSARDQTTDFTKPASGMLY